MGAEPVSALLNRPRQPRHWYLPHTIAPVLGAGLGTHVLPAPCNSPRRRNVLPEHHRAPMRCCTPGSSPSSHSTLALRSGLSQEPQHVAGGPQGLVQDLRWGRAEKTGAGRGVRATLNSL